MFGIVSQCSRKRNFYAAGMEEVSMRSFASAIDKPMLFQIDDELPNLTRHKTIHRTAKLQSNAKVIPSANRKLSNRKTELRGQRGIPDSSRQMRRTYYKPLTTARGRMIRVDTRLIEIPVSSPR